MKGATSQPRLLVVGAESTIGSALSVSMKEKGLAVVATSRRATGAAGQFIHLDLERPDSWSLPENIGCAFLCAARSNFLDCARDPEGTWNVNVTATHTLGSELINSGVFVVLLSTSAVFPGRDPWPDEDVPVEPNTAYGLQKAAVERLLLDSDAQRGRLAIVRLTKVLLPASAIVRSFLGQIRKGECVEAFSDLFIAPTSIEYVVDALNLIAVRRIGGIYHLSGDLAVSYAELARQLAKAVGSRLTVTETSCRGNPQVLYRPNRPELGMRKTTARLGLTPQPFRGMLETLVRGTPSGDR
jgi:dTDP-4-dehydrorhamnose reductase